MGLLKHLYCIVGPSGCGKDTVSRILEKKYGFIPVVSFTTRPMREGEENGKGHFFVGNPEFDRLTDIATYITFDGNRYCTTRTILHVADTYIVDPAALRMLKERYHDKRIIVIGLYLDRKTCEERMKQRGDPEDKISQRLEHDDVMFAGFREECDVVLDASQDPEVLAAQAKEAIRLFEGNNPRLDHYVPDEHRFLWSNPE